MKLAKGFAALMVIVVFGVLMTGCFEIRIGDPINEEQFRQGFTEEKGYQIEAKDTEGFHKLWLTATKGARGSADYVSVNFIIYEEYTIHAGDIYTEAVSKIRGVNLVKTVSSQHFNSFKGTGNGIYHAVIHSQHMYLEIEAVAGLKSEINNIIEVWNY